VWSKGTLYYTGTDQSSSVTASLSSTDLASGENPGYVLTFEKGGVETEFKNAGVYTVTYTLTDRNYVFSGITGVSKQFTINKAQITVTPDSEDGTYGNGKLVIFKEVLSGATITTEFTATKGTVPVTIGTDLTCTLVNSKGQEITQEEYRAYNSGTYIIKYQVSDNSNYQLTTPTVQLVVFSQNGLIVNTSEDTVQEDDKVSLREAIELINTAELSGQTITFADGITNVNLTNGDITTSKQVRHIDEYGREAYEAYQYQDVYEQDTDSKGNLVYQVKNEGGTVTETIYVKQVTVKEGDQDVTHYYEMTGENSTTYKVMDDDPLVYNNRGTLVQATDSVGNKIYQRNTETIYVNADGYEMTGENSTTAKQQNVMYNNRGEDFGETDSVGNKIYVVRNPDYKPDDPQSVEFLETIYVNADGYEMTGKDSTVPKQTNVIFYAAGTTAVQATDNVGNKIYEIKDDNGKVTETIYVNADGYEMTGKDSTTAKYTDGRPLEYDNRGEAAMHTTGEQEVVTDNDGRPVYDETSAEVYDTVTTTSAASSLELRYSTIIDGGSAHVTINGSGSYNSFVLNASDAGDFEFRNLTFTSAGTGSAVQTQTGNTLEISDSVFTNLKSGAITQSATSASNLDLTVERSAFINSALEVNYKAEITNSTFSGTNAITVGANATLTLVNDTLVETGSGKAVTLADPTTSRAYAYNSIVAGATDMSDASYSIFTQEFRSSADKLNESVTLLSGTNNIFTHTYQVDTGKLDAEENPIMKDVKVTVTKTDIFGTETPALTNNAYLISSTNTTLFPIQNGVIVGKNDNGDYAFARTKNDSGNWVWKDSSGKTVTGYTAITDDQFGANRRSVVTTTGAVDGLNLTEDVFSGYYYKSVAGTFDILDAGAFQVSADTTAWVNASGWHLSDAISGGHYNAMEIAQGSTITVSRNLTMHLLTNNGTLNIANGITLTISHINGAANDLLNNGTLYLTGNLVLQSNARWSNTATSTVVYDYGQAQLASTYSEGTKYYQYNAGTDEFVEKTLTEETFEADKYYTFNENQSQTVAAMTYGNLVLSGSRKIFSGDTLTIGGSFTTSKLNVKGSIDIANTDVIYNGSTAQTTQKVLGLTYKSLTFSGNSSKNIGSDTTVLGTFAAGDSNTTLAAAATLTLNGEFTGYSNFTANGTIVYAGAGQTVAAMTYKNLTLQSGAKTFSSAGDIIISGDFNYTSDVTVDASAATVKYTSTANVQKVFTTTYLNLYLSGGSKVFSEGVLTITGDFVIDEALSKDKIDLDKTTVIYSSADNTVIAALNYGTLVLEGSGTKTLSVGLTAKNLKIGAQGAITLESNSNIVNALTLYELADGSTLKVSGLTVTGNSDYAVKISDGIEAVIDHISVSNTVGRGVIVEDASTLTLSYSSINGVKGEALWVTGNSTATVYNATITGAEAGTDTKAAVRIDNGSTLNLINTTVAGNKVTGLYSGASAVLNVVNSVIAYNYVLENYQDDVAGTLTRANHSDLNLASTVYTTFVGNVLGAYASGSRYLSPSVNEINTSVSSWYTGTAMSGTPVFEKYDEITLNTSAATQYQTKYYLPKASVQDGISYLQVGGGEDGMTVATNGYTVKLDTNSNGTVTGAAYHSNDTNKDITFFGTVTSKAKALTKDQNGSTWKEGGTPVGSVVAVMSSKNRSMVVTTGADQWVKVVSAEEDDDTATVNFIVALDGAYTVEDKIQYKIEGDTSWSDYSDSVTVAYGKTITFRTKDTVTGNYDLICEVSDKGAVAESGDITLGNAAANAKALGGGTITFASSVKNATVYASGTLLGDITTAVTIDGALGKDSINIIAADDAALFSITNADAELTLKNITLTGKGAVTGNSGAAIDFAGKTLSMTDVKVTGFNGQNIISVNGNATATIQNSSIAGNIGRDIYSARTASVHYVFKSAAAAETAVSSSFSSNTGKVSASADSFKVASAAPVFATSASNSFMMSTPDSTGGNAPLSATTMYSITGTNTVSDFIDLTGKDDAIVEDNVSGNGELFSVSVTKEESVSQDYSMPLVCSNPVPSDAEAPAAEEAAAEETVTDEFSELLAELDISAADAVLGKASAFLDSFDVELDKLTGKIIKA